MNGALAGIRIVELTTVVLGPWAAQMLGDMGADVIKVETLAGDSTRHMGPRRNPGMGSLFLATNRNKRSVALDLRDERGQEALDRIVATADVFLHNMRPRVSARLGFSYDRFRAVNRDIIYCETYGFQRDGPLADRPAYDDIIQAASGMADLQAVTAGEPRYVPTILADKTSSFQVVSSILAALLHRERGGSGQAIEVPMYEVLVDFLMVEHLYGACFEPPIAKMGYERLLNTMRKPYATQDGYLAVLPYSDENWGALLRIAGREELIDDPRFESLAARVAHSQEVYGILADIVADRTTDDWRRLLAASNVPYQEMNTKEDLLTDAQLEASGFWRIVEHPTEGRLRLANPPVRFSATPGDIRRLQPQLGEHTAVVLAEAGYSQQRVAELNDAGVVLQHGWSAREKMDG